MPGFKIRANATPTITDKCIPVNYGISEKKAEMEEKKVNKRRGKEYKRRQRLMLQA
jgi:hypothetical protein